MGTKTRRSLSEDDYSSIEVGELVEKTDKGKKRYALAKNGDLVSMTQNPWPGKDPGYRCPECKCIVTAVYPVENIVNYWRHLKKRADDPECSLRVGKNLTKFMRYLDPKKQQRERGVLDLRLEKRGFSGWRARTIGDDKHGFPVCENNKNSIISFDNLHCHRRIFSDLDCEIQPAPYIRVEDMFKKGQVIFQAAENKRKKTYDLRFEGVKAEQIFLANELLGSSGFTRIRPGSYYSNENDEIPNVEPNNYIGITKNRLWQSKQDGPKPNHEVIINSEKLCIWVYDLEYQPNIEFLKNKYAISVKREKDKDVKFEVLIQQPIESHPTKPIMVFLAQNDSGKVIINHSKIDENGILTSFPVKSVTRPERKESDVVDKPKYVRPWREHEFTFNPISSRQNIIFESRGRYLEDFQPKPDYGITVKQKNHDIEVNFEDEILIQYFPKTGDDKGEYFGEYYSFFELSTNEPIDLLEPKFKIIFRGSLAALAQTKDEEREDGGWNKVLDEVNIFSIRYTQLDGNIGVIEGVRKLNEGIRAAELQAENLQLLEITLDDKKTRYAANTLPKIRLNYGQINDREQERIQEVEKAAKLRREKKNRWQQMKGWIKEIVDETEFDSPVAYGSQSNWNYGYLSNGTYYVSRDKSLINGLEVVEEFYSNIQVRSSYGETSDIVVNKVTIDYRNNHKQIVVRPLNESEQQDYDDEKTDWARLMQQSKRLYLEQEEERLRIERERDKINQDKLTVLRELNQNDLVAYKINEFWEYGFFRGKRYKHLDPNYVQIEISKEYGKDELVEIGIEAPYRKLNEKENEIYKNQNADWAKSLQKSKDDYLEQKRLEQEETERIERKNAELKRKTIELHDSRINEIINNLSKHDPIAYKINPITESWRYGFFESAQQMYKSKHYRITISTLIGARSEVYYSNNTTKPMRILNEAELEQYRLGQPPFDLMRKSYDEFQEQLKLEMEIQERERERQKQLKAQRKQERLDYENEIKKNYNDPVDNNSLHRWVAFKLTYDEIDDPWRYGEIKKNHVEERVSTGTITKNGRRKPTWRNHFRGLSQIWISRNLDKSDPKWVLKKDRQ